MLIRGGRVVTAASEGDADVAVEGEKIVEIGTGRLKTTIVRGQTVYQDGEIVAKPDFGRFQRCQPFDSTVAWP
jgi:dihydroorotase-like cyclic amidohydrolase